MLKKRLVFALLWQNGYFWLSRNFRIQRAGDLDWINRNYDFSKISDAIDELVVLDVSRDRSAGPVPFADALSRVVRGCFVPVAAGGGIVSLDHAQMLLRSGADKVVVNTTLFDDPTLVTRLAETYGSQCIIASIDYKIQDGFAEAVVANGTRRTGISVSEAVHRANEAGAGEVLLTSIDRDGAGPGYDIEMLRQVAERSSIPIIASGGVGNFAHLSEWLVEPRAQAACTANIFNFIGGGLLEARRQIVENGIALATWEFGWRGDRAFAGDNGV